MPYKNAPSREGITSQDWRPRFGVGGRRAESEGSHRRLVFSGGHRCLTLGFEIAVGGPTTPATEYTSAGERTSSQGDIEVGAADQGEFSGGAGYIAV